jgi:hypothetical protein
MIEYTEEELAEARKTYQAWCQEREAKIQAEQERLSKLTERERFRDAFEQLKNMPGWPERTTPPRWMQIVIHHDDRKVWVGGVGWMFIDDWLDIAK